MHTAIDWVRHPVAGERPKDSSIFVVVVNAIFEQARVTVDNSAVIRDLLTYLLLRRNPATDVSVVLDHIQPGSEGEVPEDINLLKDSAYRSIARYIENKPSQPYSVVMLLQRMILDPSKNWANPEEFTLLILSMWLFTRKMDTVDIGTQRSCLRLYYNSLAYKPDNTEREFINSDVGYGSWLLNEIDRVFGTFDDKESIIRELTYIGSFVSLLRATRISKLDTELKEVLRDEVVWLQSKTTLK